MLFTIKLSLLLIFGSFTFTVLELCPFIGLYASRVIIYVPMDTYPIFFLYKLASLYVLLALMGTFKHKMFFHVCILISLFKEY